MNIDFNNLTPSERYFAMVQSIVPRPIAWVLSDNGNKSYNLAPYSFFTGISSDPPLLMISVGKKNNGNEKGQKKDTALNIRERNKFVVHISSAANIDKLNASSATLDHGDSELTNLGIETAPFDGFDLPRLRVCKIAMGCTLYRIDEIGNTPQSIIYGKVERLFIDDALLDIKASRLSIDAEVLDPLARLGGSYYSSLGDILEASRPK